MDSTCFEMMVMPLSLATIEVVAGCWAVSALAGWAGRLLDALLGRTDEAREPRDPQQTDWDPAWVRRDAVG